MPRLPIHKSIQALQYLKKLQPRDMHASVPDHGNMCAAGIFLETIIWNGPVGVLSDPVDYSEIGGGEGAVEVGGRDGIAEVGEEEADGGAGDGDPLVVGCGVGRLGGVEEV